MNQWEMTKDEPQLIFESSLESFNDGIRTAAIGAFKIAVVHQCDRSSIGSHDVVIVIEEQTRFGIDGGSAHERSLPAPQDHPISLLSPSYEARCSANPNDSFGIVKPNPPEPAAHPPNVLR